MLSTKIDAESPAYLVGKKMNELRTEAYYKLHTPLPARVIWLVFVELYGRIEDHYDFAKAFTRKIEELHGITKKDGHNDDK